MVGGVLSALRHSGAQAVVRRPHLAHHRLQLVGLHARILLTQGGVTSAMEVKGRMLHRKRCAA